MGVLAGGTLRVHIGVSRDLASGNLWQLSLDVEGEGTKLLDIDTLASTELVVQVGDEGPPDDLHLRNKNGQ